MENSLLWSLAAGGCTVLGAFLLFFRRRWGNRSLSFFLGLAAGVMVAVVVFDMLPSAFLFSGFGKAIIGFLGGVILLKLVEKMMIGQHDPGKTLIGLGYLVMLGIAMHDLPEGMAIAFGNEMKARTGMVIALGIGIHNIPEGMAIAAPLLMGGISKHRVLFQTFLVGLITPAGALIGAAIAHLLPDLLPAMLGLASGIMIYLVIFQLLPQAKARHKGTRWWGFWLGMLVILLATYI